MFNLQLYVLGKNSLLLLSRDFNFLITHKVHAEISGIITKYVITRLISSNGLQYLITFTVILQTARTLAVATLIVSSLITHNALANFWPKSIGIPFKARLNGSLSIFFMFQIIKTIITITHVAEFTICKAVTISGKTKMAKMSIYK